jgi:hypothetical protein
VFGINTKMLRMKKIIVLFSLLVFMTGGTVSLVASPVVSMVQVTDKDPKKAPATGEKKAATSSERKDASCAEKKDANCPDKCASSCEEKKSCCNDKEKK